MEEFSPATRARALKSMEDDGVLDLLVVGGGITGVATARDAARRGLAVGLVEKSDFAAGTSSRSSKLVHGGIRYLEHLDLGLVQEGCAERRVLLDRDPTHVEALEFVYPIYKGDASGFWKVKAGMILYDLLAAFRNVHRHQMYGPRELAERAPGIRRDDLTGGACYWDARMDDARYCMATARAAAREGARLATWVEAEAIEAAPGEARLTVRDRISGTVRTLRARAVVVAAGPWTDAVRARLLGAKAPLLRPTKGVHIVVPRSRMPLTRSVLLRHPDDGRVVFNIPWGPATIIGTTDTDYTGSADDAHADGADVHYILRVANHTFPEARLTVADVVSTYTGLRPLMAQEGVDESATSREHAVVEDPGPVFTVAGGKWTTHRRMAKDVVDRVVKRLGLAAAPCTTESAPVERLGPPPVDPADSAGIESLAAQTGLRAGTVRRLARHYGAGMAEVLALVREVPRLGAPVVEGYDPILAEARFWVTSELAMTLTDALDRRTSLALVARGQGLDGAAAVAAEMAGPAGWSGDEIERQLEAFRRHVGLSRAWQKG